MANYAWAPIHLADEKTGRRKTINAGEEVNKSDFEEDDWKQFRREGIIRDREFPNNVGTGESVRTAILRQANEQYARDTGLPEAMAILDPAPSESELTEDDEENVNTEEQGNQRQKEPWEQ